MSKLVKQVKRVSLHLHEKKTLKYLEKESRIKTRENEVVSDFIYFYKLI